MRNCQVRLAAAAGLAAVSLTLGSGCAQFKERMAREWASIREDFGVKPALEPSPGGRIGPRIIDPKALLGEHYKPEATALADASLRLPVESSPKLATEIPTAPTASYDPAPPVEITPRRRAPRTTRVRPPAPPAVRAAPAAQSRSYTVRKGDSLSKIARKFYGDGRRWRAIYAANRQRMSNPNRLLVGQVIQIP